MMMRTICMLGGAGFVGRHLANRLTNCGHSVTILTRNRERHRRLLVLPAVRLLEGDVFEKRFLEHAFSGCDTVVNLVGILNEKGRNGAGFRKVHVELVDLVLSACRASGINQLLHMSALRADATDGPSHYLRSKGEAEELIRERAGNDIAWTIFRPSVIFGPDDSFTNRFATLLRLTPLIFPLARPNARFAPVYVSDVTAAMSRVLDRQRGSSDIFQLCGPEVSSLKEIVQFIAGCLALKRVVIGLPDVLSKIQAGICEFIPGKPFSLDNYRSLAANSLCDDNGFDRLDLSPRSLSSVVPRYLRVRHGRTP